MFSKSILTFFCFFFIYFYFGQHQVLLLVMKRIYILNLRTCIKKLKILTLNQNRMRGVVVPDFSIPPKSLYLHGVYILENLGFSSKVISQAQKLPFNLKRIKNQRNRVSFQVVLYFTSGYVRLYWVQGSFRASRRCQTKNPPPFS